MKPNWKLTLLRTALLVLAAGALGVAHNLISPRGIDLTRHPLETVSGLSPEVFLDLPGARRKFDENVLFIDARDELFFALGHVRGALSLPVAEFDSHVARLEERRPERELPVVCYCSGFGCEESTELAQKLIARGYSRVYVYLGGWPEWSEAGLPVEGTER